MPNQPPTRDAKTAPKPSSTKRLSPEQAKQMAAAKASRTATRKDVVRTPKFPPALKGRPRTLLMEEKRRIEIARAVMEKRREAMSKAADDDARASLKADWEREDKLYYVNDPDDKEINVYRVKEPHQYVQIIQNSRTHERSYHAIEPRLTEAEHALLNFIETTLVDVLDMQPSELDGRDIRKYIVEKFEGVLSDYSVNFKRVARSPEEQAAAKDRLLYYVLRDFIGEGPMDILINDPDIEDISCDGPHEPIFVYHRIYEALTTTIRFRNHDELDSFVIRLAQRAGKHVSIAEPILDATMRDGSRLQATLAKEVSAFGSTFTIRKFKEVPFTPLDLVKFGTMSSEMLAYLWLVIQYHMSAMYAGGTASGKTTGLNALMMFIPPQNKVVTIEDTRELRVPQPNWIAGITRGGFGVRDNNGRQSGEIDMFQLLKNALRQRPEYIIVGEVRGAEAYSLFQAMATGHAAYGTMHADSVDAVIHRLESDPINIPRSLLEALDVVCIQVQTRVGDKRVRRTKEVTEIVGVDPNTREILTNEVFTWDPTVDQFKFTGVSYALDRIALEAGTTLQDIQAEMQDRVKLIDALLKSGTDDYSIVAGIITSYYRDKPSVMRKLAGGRPWQ